MFQAVSRQNFLGDKAHALYDKIAFNVFFVFEVILSLKVNFLLIAMLVGQDELLAAT